MSTQPTNASKPGIVTDDEEVLAILADPAYQVPPAPPVPISESGTLAWLRAHVARFCDGEVHDRRRELAESELARLDPAQLRAAAADLTRAELAAHVSDTASETEFDAMSIARRVPVAVLAAALGVSHDVLAATTDAVLASASGYPNPDAAGPGADAAVRLLANTLGPADAELLANRIGLLEQACDATAGLIGNALVTAFAGTDPTGTDPTGTDAIVARTVSGDPPVLRTRRVSPDGEVVTVDLSSCTFGAGRPPCPGADQATALAAGVLDAMLPACELADQQLSYLPSPNLRIPDRLLIMFSE